jgi:redox-sensitive bicupin YhaK (pirin superfamily)
VLTFGSDCAVIFTDRPNPTRFWQIWLNSAAQDKRTPPEIVMNWRHQVLKWTSADGKARVTVWLGSFNGNRTSAAVPARSWAAREENDVAVLHITIDAGGELVLDPAANPVANRALYLVEGGECSIDGRAVRRGDPATMIELDSKVSAPIKATSGQVEFLLLQGVPINEPVVQHGPFVMNSQAEIRESFMLYQQTQFGGWPWPRDAMVFPATKGRHLIVNGKEVAPPDADDFLKAPAPRGP